MEAKCLAGTSVRAGTLALMWSQFAGPSYPKSFAASALPSKANDKGTKVFCARLLNRTHIEEVNTEHGHEQEGAK